MHQPFLPGFEHQRGQCPHCGHRAPLAAFVPVSREALLAHEAIRALRPAQRYFLVTAPKAWLGGAVMGLAELAAAMPYSYPTVQYHVNALADHALVQPVPMRDGGVYHRYRFVFPTPQPTS